jgi:hypothetical protein
MIVSPVSPLFPKGSTSGSPIIDDLFDRRSRSSFVPCGLDIVKQFPQSDISHGIDPQIRVTYR